MPRGVRNWLVQPTCPGFTEAAIRNFLWNRCWVKRCPTLTDFSLGKRIPLARPLFPNNSDRIILQFFAILCIFITKKNAASVFFVEN
jgi:hypothetical protein